MHAGLNKDPRQCHYALISRFRILPLLQLILPTVSYIQDNAIKTLFFEANKLLAGLNKSEWGKTWEMVFQTFTRFLEITDRKEGDKCYSNSRLLSVLRKIWMTYATKKVKLKCRWINKCDSANFMVEIRNWTTELGKHATSTFKEDEHYSHFAYLQGDYHQKLLYIFLRIVFAVIKKRATRTSRKDMTLLGFVEKILYAFKSYLYFG